MNELPQRSQTETRGGVCVLVAAAPEDVSLDRCLDSLREHTAPEVRVLRIEDSTAALNLALAELAPADAVVLEGCCAVTPGWLERLRAAARADTNTATASALCDVGGPLALRVDGDTPTNLAASARALGRRTMRLRPRIARAVGPCVYVRREALELVGALEEGLPLVDAVEVDFAQRCVLSGLTHLAADDVLVGRLAAPPPAGDPPLLPLLLERYPHLAGESTLGESAVLEHALGAVRERPDRLAVTLDARALDGAVTGTQVNILELILALARTGALALRLLIRPQRIDARALELLSSLPDTQLLDERELGPTTPVTRIFHRPQQAFAAEDVALATALGERLVLSQLDLIAYRNPGYFPDADSWRDYRLASRHGLAAAERVVVFSEHTREELLADGLTEPDRVRVVPPGLDHRPAAQARRPAAFELDGAAPPPDGFLLCLGTDFRHKNRLFALRLLAALRDEHGSEASLVLAGTQIPNGSSRELERAFMERRADLADAVVELGPVDEEEKAWLMAHAGAVVYPSAYEGFGMVPFESALRGVPCLFAPQSSLAEAAPAGTATIVPWDAAASARAAHGLMSDPDARAEHLAALAASARELTWDRAASAMVEVYREAASAPLREAAVLSRDAIAREGRLTAAHEIVVERLIGERRHAQRMYDELNAEVGSGLSLIGPHGALPDDAQRALLSISAHPRVARPLFGGLARVFGAARALGRTARRRS